MKDFRSRLAMTENSKDTILNEKKKIFEQKNSY